MTNLHHWLYVILLQMGAIIYSYCVFQSSKEERHTEKISECIQLLEFFFLVNNSLNFDYSETFGKIQKRSK